MKVTIDIPDSLERSLHEQLGQDVARSAKESLAVAWYQAERLSIGQVAELLGLSVYEAEGFLKRQRVAAPFTWEDFEHDRETLNRLLNP
jgi:predicted HTH domain antitoxin